MDIKDYLDYNPESGKFFWIRKANQNTLIGSEAGHVNKRGYIEIRFNKKKYLAHRLAFLFMTGKFPENETVDHINRNPSDNKWSNLRDVSQQINSLNREAKRVYKTPYGNYLVQIRHRGKMFFQKTFKDEELAELAAIEAMDIRNKREGFQIKA